MYLGLTILVFAGIIALIKYWIVPIFANKAWVGVSPAIHLVSVAAGTFLFWLGSENLIKDSLKSIHTSLHPHLLYRFTYATVFLLCSIMIIIIIKFPFSIFLSGDDDEDDEYDYQNANRYSERDRTADDIWDIHPQHYYDQDPPGPLS
jgi:hypothetical protein